MQIDTTISIHVDDIIHRDSHLGGDISIYVDAATLFLVIWMSYVRIFGLVRSSSQSIQRKFSPR